ncbi:hypothetical protein OUZ56_024615 [Daphnia magna]|uniref:Uncharacterized protein n=1 Tax=Daphnia magna TaxID=35525 RepID=A0ABR0B134_9CRUS|nr:hypothetical protein OUZ56_024615 [Daphnia magna]
MEHAITSGSQSNCSVERKRRDIQQGFYPVLDSSTVCCQPDFLRGAPWNPNERLRTGFRGPPEFWEPPGATHGDCKRPGKGKRHKKSIGCRMGPTTFINRHISMMIRASLLRQREYDQQILRSHKSGQSPVYVVDIQWNEYEIRLQNVDFHDLAQVSGKLGERRPFTGSHL